MRLLGAILIMASAALGCAALLREKKKSQEDCRSLADALELLRGELSFVGIPLNQGIERARAHAHGAGKEFLAAVYESFDSLGEHSFGEIWDKALTNLGPRLPDDPISELRKLGSVLGRFDLELQLRSLDVCVLQLREQWQRQSNAYPSQRRVAFGLSISLSVLLVILLY